MTITRATSYQGLPVCKNCGWAVAGIYETDIHARSCPDAEAGKSAENLAERLADLPSTKFGRGNRQLTFELEPDLNIRFECDKDGTFQLRSLWLLDDLSVNEAAGLVRAIATWRRACLHERNK